MSSPIGEDVPSNRRLSPGGDFLQPIKIVFRQKHSNSMLSAYLTKTLQKEKKKRQGSTVNNFPQREIRVIKNFEIIDKAVTRNIPEATLQLILGHFNTSTKMHGPLDSFYSSCSREQCVKLILYYMLKHNDPRMRAEELRETWDLNKNAMSKILDRLAPALDDFVTNNLTKRSNEQLLEVARSNCSETFHSTVGSVDGVHMKVLGLQKDLISLFPDSFKSIKFHWQHAIGFQVVVAHDMRAEFCDSGNGAGVSDIRALWRSNAHLAFANTTLLGDLGYQNTYYPVNIQTRFKSPKNQDEIDYNAAHGRDRGKIERYYGILKSYFGFTRTGYHGPLRHLERLVKLALIITNDIIRVHQNDFTDEQEELIQSIIATDVRYSFQEPVYLVNNSLFQTFPEVLVDPRTGQHQINWPAPIEDNLWQRRDSNTLQQSTMTNSPPEGPRGANREPRRIRPRPPSSGNEERREVPSRPGEN
jgi:hypothetical protein